MITKKLIFCIFKYEFDILFFFFNDTATTEIYTLSLHDALPIFGEVHVAHASARQVRHLAPVALDPGEAPQVLFTRHRDDRHVACALAVGRRPHLEHQLLTRRWL